MLKVVFVLTVLIGHVFALSFSTLSSKPKSIEKDFYIYLYLKNHSVSKHKAKKLFSQVNRFNSKLKKEFARYGLYYKSSKNKFTKPDIAYDLKSMLTLSPKEFLNLFNNLTPWHVGKYLDGYIPKDYLKEIAKYEGFNKFTKIILSSRASKLKYSIKNIRSDKAKAESSFYMALNNLENKNVAVYYLKQANRYAVSDFKKNRATFWLYLVTKDKSYLKKLTKSKEINLYSLYAYENLHKKFTNLVTEFPKTLKKPPFNYKDPFAWLKKRQSLYQNLRGFDSNKAKRAYLKRKLSSVETFPHLAYMLRDYDKKNYFLFPYQKYIKNLPKKRQALILAIAKQESNFIPTAVSPSFALGMMQFMPFLLKHEAKKFGMKNFKLTDIFEPKLAYKFANDHLNYLQKYLHHPLLIAYAYNAGIGYTKRNILKSGYYFTQNEYEPFYSLEMVTPEQPMHYAKKVLANYVVYANILGINITVTELLKELKDIKSRHEF